MANTTLKELKYRKFDDLINEVYIDLPSFTREGMVEPAQLIKIAQMCNYELGLKIYQTKETILDIEHGRTKLPSDFHILNYALVCGRYTVCEPSPFNGLHTEDVYTPIPQPILNAPTACPCWTITTYHPCQVGVVHCDGTAEYLAFFPNPDDTPSVTKMCLQSIDVDHAFGAPGSITATTNTFCYKDASSAYTCDQPDPCCHPVDNTSLCEANLLPSDPWHQDKCFVTCNGKMEVKVIEYHSNEIREYRTFEQIRMIPSREASSFCVNTSFRDAPHTGNIKDGYLWVPTINNGRGRMYICYLGAMEDEEGNLLVLDHPKINNYYEWALKERVLQNIYLNGEPDMLQRWQMAKKELDKARAEALSITTMPDFSELKRVVEENRKAAYSKYLHPFSSLYANTPGWPWSFNNERI